MDRACVTGRSDARTLHPQTTMPNLTALLLADARRGNLAVASQRVWAKKQSSVRNLAALARPVTPAPELVAPAEIAERLNQLHMFAGCTGRSSVGAGAASAQLVAGDSACNSRSGSLHIRDQGGADCAHVSPVLRVDAVVPCLTQQLVSQGGTLVCVCLSMRNSDSGQHVHSSTHDMAAAQYTDDDTMRVE